MLLALTGAFVAGMALFGGAGHWRAIEAWRASERLAPVAARVVVGFGQDKLDLAAVAERIGLTRDPSLLGYIDNNAERPPGGQFVQGWAGDASLSARPVDVLIFQCGAFLGAAPVGEDRPDVAAALRVSRQGFGFGATLPKQRCFQDRPAGLIVTQDQRYAVITAPAPR